jgi:hypothetical protein
MDINFKREFEVIENDTKEHQKLLNERKAHQDETNRIKKCMYNQTSNYFEILISEKLQSK